VQALADADTNMSEHDKAAAFIRSLTATGGVDKTVSK